MSTYKSANVDFDNLFDPDVVGDGPAAAGYKQGGVPLKYAAIKYGTKGPDCGYAQAGVDVSNLWAKKGSAAYKLPCDGMTGAVGEHLLNGDTGYAYVRFAVSTDGSYNFFTNRGPHPALGDTTVVSAGPWNTLGGSAAGYQVRYTISNIQYPSGGGLGATTSNDAAAFTTISADRGVQIRVDGSFSNGTREITADLKIELKRISDGRVFSTTNVHMSALIDGSV